MSIIQINTAVMNQVSAMLPSILYNRIYTTGEIHAHNCVISYRPIQYRIYTFQSFDYSFVWYIYIYTLII
jgi:hypothetical protein